MTTCIIRTGIIYILLVLAIRLTGKRQIGELEISELVSTILISEIASAPVSNQDVPLSFAIIPMILIISFEVIISFSATRSNIVKKIFLGSPSVLIKRGKIQAKELSKSRMSIEELLCELRVSGISSIEDVDYAILESNGKLSVTPHARARNATPADLGLKLTNNGIAHAIIVDGVIKKEALNGSGKNMNWLESKLEKYKLTVKELFLFTVDDADNIYIIKRKDTQ